MFAVLILVCLASTPRAECQRETAIDVIAGPPAASEVQCGLYGQAYLAETALAVREGEYVKIRCQRTTIAGGNVG